MNATPEEQLKLAKSAISHVLNAFIDDPRKFYLMGDGTGSFEKLTAAASALWSIPQDKIKADFRPPTAKWEQYLRQRERDEAALSERSSPREAIAKFLDEYAPALQPHGGIGEEPMTGEHIAFHARRILAPHRK